MPSDKDVKPLALSDTLRDLAVLRASDVDLSALLASVPSVTRSAKQAAEHPEGANSEREILLTKAYTFVSEAKAAMKIMNSGLVDNQGARIEDVRVGLDEVVKGLEGGSVEGDEPHSEL